MAYKDKGKRRATERRYREANKDAARARFVRWREAHKDTYLTIMRGDHLRRKYGLTLTRFEDMVAARGPNCPICERESKPHVDHCHKTGFVRGLPCSNCNRALGMVADDPATLRRMADYIEKANAITEILS